MTDQPTCTATVKAKDGNPARPCKRPPCRGARVCASHGGRAPQVRRKAAERVVEAQLMKAAEHMVTTPVTDPLTALSEFAAEVIGWKDLIGNRVQRLEDVRYSSPAGEQLRAEIGIWERALDRVNTVLATIARLNIDERLAKISEQQAERLDMLLSAVFLDLALTPDQQREGRAHLARRIRALR